MVEEASAEDSATLDGEGVYVSNVPLALEDNQLHLQQESYHRPTTAVVGLEATEERATVMPEDFVESDGTLRSTLRVWAGRRGPVAYNMW